MPNLRMAKVDKMAEFTIKFFAFGGDFQPAASFSTLVLK